MESNRRMLKKEVINKKKNCFFFFSNAMSGNTLKIQKNLIPLQRMRSCVVYISKKKLNVRTIQE